MTYSSAVFASPDESLAEAQHRKFDRLCDRLALGADDHVLEIGCGWGGSRSTPRRRADAA